MGKIHKALSRYENQPLKPIDRYLLKGFYVSNRWELEADNADYTAAKIPQKNLAKIAEELDQKYKTKVYNHTKKATEGKNRNLAGPESFIPLRSDNVDEDNTQKEDTNQLVSIVTKQVTKLPDIKIRQNQVMFTHEIDETVSISQSYENPLNNANYFNTQSNDNLE